MLSQILLLLHTVTVIDPLEIVFLELENCTNVKLHKKEGFNFKLKFLIRIALLQHS